VKDQDLSQGKQGKLCKKLKVVKIKNKIRR